MQPLSDPQNARTHSEAMAAKRPPRRYSPPGFSGSATLATEPVPIVRGTLIGDYRVERRLDEGGMGTVYAAVHPIIDKRVAIKVLHPHVARQEDAVARFIQEARAVNAIGHPGIVDIFGFGRFVDGRHFITMEYLEGQQLLAFLNETGPLSPMDMLPVARQLAESLAAAHDKGVVHRDMKPENVFLGVTASTYKDQPWPPRTKILDFGLAKLIEAETGDAAPRTRAGVTVGTPYYMSPEQCRGKALDRRADVYSLGVMMYEMITGRVPFYAAESVDVLYMHLTQAPEPPSRHRPVPSEIEELILGCMAKTPAERPASMQELVAELDRILRALSPDAARDRDPVELQAEASAFFGGVEDGQSPVESGASGPAFIRPTVPTLPQDLRQAVLAASSENPAPPAPQAGDPLLFQEGSPGPETMATPMAPVGASVLPAPPQAPSLSAPSHQDPPFLSPPAAHLEGSRSLGAETAAPQTASGLEPSTPSEAPAPEERGVSLREQAPEDAPQVAGSPAPASQLTPLPASPTDQRTLGAEPSETGDPRIPAIPHKDTSDLKPLSDAHPAEPKRGPGHLLWMVIGLQFVVILLLVVFLLGRG